MRHKLLLGIPKGGRYKKDAEKIIEEFKTHKIPFETKELDEPDAMPSLAFRPNSLVWQYVGYEEIMAFVEHWESFWKPSFEKEEELEKSSAKTKKDRK